MSETNGRTGAQSLKYSCTICHALLRGTAKDLDHGVGTRVRRVLRRLRPWIERFRTEANERKNLGWHVRQSRIVRMMN